MRCGKKVRSEEILSAIQSGLVPRCQALKKQRSSSTATTASSNSSVSSSSPCSSRGDSPALREPSSRAAKKRRRLVTSLFTLVEGTSADNSSTYDSELVCGGVLKPAVTFFGEALHDNVRRKIEADRKKADALIVIGTSLSVAPISKVIEYLPSNIPRILINRTIVHPSTTSASCDIEDDNENGNSKDFRENYVFDAYLLGYCDDVTRALGRKLFSSKITAASTGIDTTIERPEKKKRHTSSEARDTLQIQLGGLLTHALEGKEENWKADEWTSVNVPPERVLLFPGALASKDDSSSEVTYREVAHCDGCSVRICGVIKKCVNCFDFDLCANCFPTLSKTHFGGTHNFSTEISSL